MCRANENEKNVDNENNELPFFEWSFIFIATIKCNEHSLVARYTDRIQNGTNRVYLFDGSFVRSVYFFFHVILLNYHFSNGACLCIPGPHHFFLFFY